MLTLNDPNYFVFYRFYFYKESKITFKEGRESAANLTRSHTKALVTPLSHRVICDEKNRNLKK